MKTLSDRADRCRAAMRNCGRNPRTSSVGAPTRGAGRCTGWRGLRRAYVLKRGFLDGAVGWDIASRKCARGLGSNMICWEN